MNSASLADGSLAGASIATVKGQGLTNTTLVGDTFSPPTRLGDVQVSITDSKGTGRLAPLFYISPSQINYQVPPDTAPGPAVMTVTSSVGSSTGSLTIASTAPGIYSFTSDGQGLAIAQVQRFATNGTQTLEATASYDAAVGRFRALPIVVSPESGAVYLAIYGTGFRNRSSLAGVTARIGGQNVPVLYAGAQGQYPGLDQINIGPLPSSLQGALQIVLTVDGTSSNTLQLTFPSVLSPADITLGLTGAWSFNASSISNGQVADVSTSGFHGTVVGTLTTVPGVLGEGVSFGSGSYITLPNKPAFALTHDLTIAGWVKTTNSTRDETLFAKLDTAGTEDGYLFYTTKDGYLALRFGGVNIGGNRTYVDGTNKINDGRWHHIGLILRPGQDLMFYVDGGLSSVYYLTILPGAVNAGVSIAAPTFYSSGFSGSIDDVRFYGRPLSTTEFGLLYGAKVTVIPGGELLSNGVAMPRNFPPPLTVTQFARTPYYINNSPSVIPIDVGRQLFVDDFLIDATTLVRSPHRPVMLPNPVLTPGMPFSGGAWFDPADRRYKLWYLDSDLAAHYAFSTDGVTWQKPSIPDALQANTNVVLPWADTVWLDLEEQNPARRYKGFWVDQGSKKVIGYYSADGIRWIRQPFDINSLSDRTTMFWNPFRKVWVNSDRSLATLPVGNTRPSYTSRARFYSESKDLTTWTPADPSKTFWTGPEEIDQPYTPGGQYPELYNLDAVAYESVMVGLFSWFYPGIGYQTYSLPGPILVELGVGFSRDGFSWSRPFRGSQDNAFIPASNVAGTWNGYNTQSTGGGFLVVGDELWFYFSARSEKKPADGIMSTGLAKLRRDGFASMDAGAQEGVLQTKPLRFTGNHFFVNVAAASGKLQAEILDADGVVVPGFSRSASAPISADKTLQEMKWSGADLGTLSGKDVKIRFYLTNGQLYSFWVTSDPLGTSHGYVAAGGPQFDKAVDSK